VKTLIAPRKRYLVISICRWRGTYSVSPEPKHHSETDSLKLFKLDEMQMDTNVVIVPNSAVLPRKALRISPNESMDQQGQ